MASISDTLRQQPGIYSDPTPILTGYGQGNDMYGGGSIPQYGPNYTTRPAGSWGTPAPQPQYPGGYTMVSISHTIIRNEHLLTLVSPINEAKQSTW